MAALSLGELLERRFAKKREDEHDVTELVARVLAGGGSELEKQRVRELLDLEPELAEAVEAAGFGDAGRSLGREAE